MDQSFNPSNVFRITRISLNRLTTCEIFANRVNDFLPAFVLHRKERE
jgi:hypothetical protein